MAELLEKVANGQAAEGMEALIPALVDDLELLIDVMPANTLVLVNDPELVRTRAEDLVRTSQEFLHAGWAAAASGGKAPIDMGSSAYWQLADVRSHALGRGQSWWTLSSFSSAPEDDEDAPEALAEVRAERASKPASLGHQLDLVDTVSWHGDVEGFVEQIRTDVREGWRVLLSVEGAGPASRLTELLGEHDVAARIVDDLDEVEATPVVQIFRSGLRNGFRASGVMLVTHTAADITGTGNERTARKLPAKRRNQIVPLELKPGDALVHQQHGVGRYVEMVQRTVAGATRNTWCWSTRAQQARPTR